MSSSGLFPSRPLWPLTPLALACLIVSGETLGADGRPSELPSQVITANPLGNESPATPSSVLEGDELTLRQKGSLGETLNGLPGVSSTYFGPGASRPVIRGMDGDRIRLLRNGVGALDASSLSYDHAVPEDPNSVERLEVVRGPAALLYGGNAIGGVVNSFDNRIPSEPVDASTAAANCATAAPTPPVAAPAHWRPATATSPCTWTPPAASSTTSGFPATPIPAASGRSTATPASIGCRTATAARTAAPSVAPITGSTVTPASPTAATTATMARRPRTTCA